MNKPDFLISLVSARPFARRGAPRPESTIPAIRGAGAPARMFAALLLAAAGLLGVAGVQAQQPTPLSFAPGDSIADLRLVAGVPAPDVLLPAARGGGSGPKVYAIAPPLPPGLTFNDATRTLTVAPTAAALLAETVYTYGVSEPADPRVTPASLEFTISVSNELPVANAGPDFVVARNVTVPQTSVYQGLNGSRSLDPEFGALEYAWTQTGGASVVLSDAAVAAPSFTSPSTAGRLSFMLTVTDEAGQTATDTVIVTVEQGIVANLLLSTDQLPEEDNPRVTVGLTGSPSQQVTVSLRTVAGTATPGEDYVHFDRTFTFAANATGQALEQGGFFLDNISDRIPEPPETVILEFYASTGPVTLGSPREVTYLDNDGYDNEGNPTVPGIDVTDMGRVVFIQGRAQTMTLPRPPRASEGLQAAVRPQLPAGLRFDRDTWAITGTAREVTGPRDYVFDVRASNPPDAMVQATFQLEVVPDAGNNEPGPLSFRPGDAIADLRLAAGVPAPDVVLPEARGGGLGRKVYTITPPLPPGLTFNGATRTLSAAPTAAAIAAEEVYTYTVSRPGDPSLIPASLKFTITITNELPVANAGPDFVAAQDVTVPQNSAYLGLNGARSVDPEFGALEYAWTQTGGASVVLSDAAVAAPSFTSPSTAGRLTFMLTVTDEAGQTATDTVTVTVVEGVVADLIVSNEDPPEHAGGPLVTVRLTGSPSQRVTVSLRTVAGTAMPGEDYPHFDRTFTFAANATGEALTQRLQFNLTVDRIPEPPETVILEFYASTGPVTLGSARKITILDDDGYDNEGEPRDPDIDISDMGRVTFIQGRAQTMTLPHAPYASLGLQAAVRPQLPAGLVFDPDAWAITGTAREVTGPRDYVFDVRASNPRNTMIQTTFQLEVVPDAESVLEPVAEFMLSHAESMLSNQPSLGHLLGAPVDGQLSYALPYSLTNGGLSGSFRDGNTWGDLSMVWSDTDSLNGHSMFASFGAHARLSGNMLAGMMLQLDDASQDRDGGAGNISGSGWMVGPYMAARHADHPLRMEGQLLYGQGSVEYDLADTDRRGEFDGGRLLARFRFEGERALESGIRLVPFVDAGYVRSDANGFTDADGHAMPSHGVSLNRYELGLDLGIPVSVAEGSMVVTPEFGYVLSSTDGGRYGVSSDSNRARLGVNVNRVKGDGQRLWLNTFYDGIGESNNKRYGLSAGMEVRF